MATICTGMAMSCTGMAMSCTFMSMRCTGIAMRCTGIAISCTSIVLSCTCMATSCTLKQKFSPQEVFLLMREAIWRHGKLKFTPQAVFPFMQETMWLRGKLKIYNRKSSFGCGKHSPVVGICPVRMCLVLVPNIGISTSISNTTQIRAQHFRKVMCVHWECAWCQCQILALAPAYPTLHK